jgi:hypothetical protein
MQYIIVNGSEVLDYILLNIRARYFKEIKLKVRERITGTLVDVRLVSFE